MPDNASAAAGFSKATGIRSDLWGVRSLDLATFYFLTFLTIALLTVRLLAGVFVDDLALINFPFADFFTALDLAKSTRAALSFGLTLELTVFLAGLGFARPVLGAFCFWPWLGDFFFEVRLGAGLITSIFLFAASLSSFLAAFNSFFKFFAAFFSARFASFSAILFSRFTFFAAFSSSFLDFFPIFFDCSFSVFFMSTPINILE